MLLKKKDTLNESCRMLILEGRHSCNESESSTTISGGSAVEMAPGGRIFTAQT